MDLHPVMKKVERIAAYRASWRASHLRARMQVEPDGITVTFKGGAEQPGYPGEEMTYFHPAADLDASLQIAEAFKETPNEDDLVTAGFKQTRYIMID